MEINSQNLINLERNKLNKMVDDSLKNHVSLSTNAEVQKQGKFLEQLIDISNKQKENR